MKSELKRKRALSVVSAVALFLLFSFISCKDSRNPSEAQVREQYKNSKALNETAAFLAGINLAGSSPFYQLTQNDQYRQYQNAINALWEQYQTKDLKNIEAWRKNNLAFTQPVSGTIMYPFSGPDILNALAFFPDADEFVMIGLELPGNVPDPLHYTGPNIYGELLRIKTALRTILQLNLFRTIEMMFDFKAESFSNITGIMMFFLARYNYEILDIKKIYVNQAGAIVTAAPKPEEKKVEGVEFIFRKGKGLPLKTARFFSVDLSDGSLAQLLGFSQFLSKKKNFVTLLKSASYLLSYDNFKVMRSYLIGGSAYLVQEDSGIPYKYFPETEWKMSFYGTYRVIAVFANRFQYDLDTAFKQKSKGQLPFSFGYGFIPEKSCIMIAEKLPLTK